MQEIQRDMPDFYVVDWVMQSAESLPQHRERLYTVGLRRDAWGAGILAPPRLPRQAQLLRTRLADILHQGLPKNCEAYIHGQPRANLMASKRTTLANRPRGKAGCYCFPIDRDPTMTFAPGQRSDGNVCALRTGNDVLWVLMINSAGTVVLSRCLHPVERLGLQGFKLGQGSSFAFHWQRLHCTSHHKCLEAVAVAIGASWRIGS